MNTSDDHTYILGENYKYLKQLFDMQNVYVEKNENKIIVGNKKTEFKMEVPEKLIDFTFYIMLLIDVGLENEQNILCNIITLRKSIEFDHIAMA